MLRKNIRGESLEAEEERAGEEIGGGKPGRQGGGVGREGQVLRIVRGEIGEVLAACEINIDDRDEILSESA